jgi:nucleoside-diphosphate-sugar epimerase
VRVFVTGASGHIGSAVVPELLESGHQVIGLARSDASAAALTAMGAEVQRGDLDDLGGLADAAAKADGVIHLAFKHDIMAAGGMAAATAADLAAIEAIGEALVGSEKPFVVSAGTTWLAVGGISGRPATEDDVVVGDERIACENTALGLADQGVTSSVMRLPPSVHSPVDVGGLVPEVIKVARERGVSGYVDDGANVWPAVHTADAAVLYRLALERAKPGARIHAVAEEGIPFREIATGIARGLGVDAVSVPSEEAVEHFGFLGSIVVLDNPVSSASTRETLGWEPTHSGLLAEIEAGHYFA